MQRTYSYVWFLFDMDCIVFVATGSKIGKHPPLSLTTSSQILLYSPERDIKNNRSKRVLS